MEVRPIYPAGNAPTVLKILESIAYRSEEELIEDAQHGLADAFGKLMETYQSRMLRLAENIVRQREDAEEAMQSAFIKAFKNLHRFRGDSRFSTWLSRITINEALMRVRKRSSREIAIDDFEASKDNNMSISELQDGGLTPEEDLCRKELRSVLARTIGQLPLGYRSVFQLRDVEGLSTAETAEALGLSASSVKTRLRRARCALRPLLKKRLSIDGLPERSDVSFWRPTVSPAGDGVRSR